MSQFIPLTDDLSMKKLDPTDDKDLWLASKLDEDEFIAGKNGYLWSICNLLQNTRYLYWDSCKGPYGIYYQNDPVGYFDIDQLFGISSCAELSYAILSTERKKSYAFQTLLAAQSFIFEEFSMMQLTIRQDNQASKNLAIKCQFESVYTEQQARQQGFYEYRKTKEKFLHRG